MPLPKRNPNIVFILADDLGFGDIGCYGAPSLVRTPNIDRIAREGIRFLDAHSPSSVCTPTRYNLLTGRYCWRTWAKTGCIWWHDPLLIDEGQTTIASLLKRQGYTTGMVGKWHLGFGRPGCDGWDDIKGLDPNASIAPGPCEVGFDSFFGVPAISQKPHIFIRNHDVVDLSPDDPMEIIPDTKPEWMTDYQQRPRTHNPNIDTDGGHAAIYSHEEVTKVLTREAVSFLEDHAGQANPFFLYYSARNVHSPLIPHPDFKHTSDCGVYGDFIHELDWSVGEILKSLDRLGISDDTLVIFTSDNGATEHHRPVEFVDNEGLRSNGPFRGQKSEVYEGGHRVPLIARWPGKIPSDRSSRQLIALTDMLATFAALTGTRLDPGEGPDSFNMLPALLDDIGNNNLRPALAHDSMMGQLFAIRSEEWKLILGQGGGGLGAGWLGKTGIEQFAPGDPPMQLYNLDDDVFEQQNLYRKYPDIVNRLKRLYEVYQNESQTVSVG